MFEGTKIDVKKASQCEGKGEEGREEAHVTTQRGGDIAKGQNKLISSMHRPSLFVCVRACVSDDGRCGLSRGRLSTRVQGVGFIRWVSVRSGFSGFRFLPSRRFIWFPRGCSGSLTFFLLDFVSGCFGLSSQVDVILL